MKTKIYKTKGLEYYVVGVYNEFKAATVFIENGIGVMPCNLEVFEGEIDKNVAKGIFYTNK